MQMATDVICPTCHRKIKRTSDQNARMHAMIRDVARQVVWHGLHRSEEVWKRIFTAAWRKQEIVPGLNQDFVVVGVETSKMSKQECSDVMELIAAFGTEHNVTFKEIDDEQYPF